MRIIKESLNQRDTTKITRDDRKLKIIHIFYIALNIYMNCT